MDEALMKFLLEFAEVDKSQLSEIIKNINIQNFKKGTLLLKEGDVLGSQCYFVIKGCVRQYYLSSDGEEITSDFFTENQAIHSFNNATLNTTSKHFLECVEDCILTISNVDKETEMYQQFPGLETMTRKMTEQNFGKTQEDFERFVAASPEQRYLNLLKTRPGLFNRVPNHQIASYLGMKPESLSRIKRRIIKEN